MSQTTQTTQTPTPKPEIESIKIDIVIRVRHIFDGDTYNRTQVEAEIYGEAVIAGRRIVFPYRVLRSQDLTYDIGSFIQSVLDDIKLQKELMIEDITNYAKNRKTLLEELSKISQIEEEYVQNYDEDDP